MNNAFTLKTIVFLLKQVSIKVLFLFHVFILMFGVLFLLLLLQVINTLSFIDDCTRVYWVYLMKSKNDVINVIPQFYKMIITQFLNKVQVFHSDNGHEL